MTTWILAWSLALSAGIELILAIWVWRNSKASTALPFAVSMICCAGWSIFYGTDVIAETIPGKIFQSQIRIFFVSILAPAWYLWIRRFARPNVPLGRLEIAFLAGYPILQAPFLFTMPYHKLFQYDFALLPSGDLFLLQYRMGPAQQLFAIWANLINIAAICQLLRLILSGRHSYDVRRVWIILGVTLAPGLVNGFFLLGFSPIPNYNLAPNILLFTGIVIAWALYRYRLIDLLPYARNTAFTSLEDGLLVFDRQSCLVDFNTAAQRLLELDAMRDIGQGSKTVLAWAPAAFSLLENSTAADEHRTLEVIHPSNENSRFLELTFHAVLGDGGTVDGTIIVVRDITSRARLEADLRTSEARSRLLLEAAPYPVLVTDLQNQIIIYANPFALAWASLAGEEVLGRPAMGFYRHPSDRAAIVRELEEKGSVTGREVDLFRGNEFATVLMNVSLIVFEGRRSAYVSFMDITSWRKTEETLRKLEIEQREMLVSEQEKQRIGRDLHDGLGQMLTGASMICRALEEKMAKRGVTGFPEVEVIRTQLSLGVQQARILAHGLNPIELTGIALHTFIGELAEQIRVIWRIDCRLLPERPIAISPPSLALQLLRITQEALHNSVRHGSPGHITITLAADPPVGRLEIVDDGSGFSLGKDLSKGSGLETMRFRSNQIGGTLNLSSAEGKGTIVTCTFPC